MNNVSVTTDKKKYKVGEQVLVAVKNNSKEKIYLQQPFPQHFFLKILKKSGSSFKEINAVNGDGFIKMGEMQERVFPIAPGKEMSYGWIGYDYDKGRMSQPTGTFKARLVFSTEFEDTGAESYLKEPLQNADSAEFEIN